MYGYCPLPYDYKHRVELPHNYSGMHMGGTSPQCSEEIAQHLEELYEEIWLDGFGVDRAGSHHGDSSQGAFGGKRLHGILERKLYAIV